MNFVVILGIPNYSKYIMWLLSIYQFDDTRRVPVTSHETALEGDDSEEWQDVDVSEEWGPITPSMATTTCCDVIEPHQEFVNIIHKHHHPSGVSYFWLIHIQVKFSIKIFPFWLINIKTSFFYLSRKPLPMYITTISTHILGNGNKTR